MNLTNNIGRADKMIRLFLGVVAAAFGIFMAGLGTAVGIFSFVVGVVFVGTGTINFCPAFKVLGISTTKRPDPMN